MHEAEMGGGGSSKIIGGDTVQRTSMRVRGGRVLKELRGHGVERIDGLYREVSKNEFRNRDGQDDSGAEKHQDMQVRGPGVSNDCSRGSTRAPRSRDCRRSSQETSVRRGEVVSIRATEGREPRRGQ